MDADALRRLDAEQGIALVDYAERPRVGDWSLRSALVRYAQVAPVAASAVLETLRRTDGALRPHVRPIERTSVAEADDAFAGSPGVVDLLAPAATLDRLGDVLAAWADGRTDPPPHAEVEALTTTAFAQLAELGVPRETRPPRRAGAGD